MDLTVPPSPRLRREPVVAGAAAGGVKSTGRRGATALSTGSGPVDTEEDADV